MSFSSGTFSLVAGNPVVTGTTVSSTVQNNTMNDVATGLSTCMLKDGTQTATADVGYLLGVKSSIGMGIGARSSPLGGIAFPASQVAVGDVNTLDDYIEGTWTPVLTFATPGDLSVSYTTQVGTYTKVGRFVTASCTIITSAFTFSTASGNVRITGCPVTPLTLTGATWHGGGAYSGITKANYTNFSSRIGSNSTIITVIASGSGQAASNVTAADMPSAGSVTIDFTISFESA